MLYPSLSEFKKFSRTANLVPVYTRISADLDTPVSSFLKLPKSGYSFLLESVEGQEKIARYSFLGSNPGLIFRTKGRRVEIRESGGKVRTFDCADPFVELRKLMKRFTPAKVPGLPRFFAGMVGYIGYDAVRFFEKAPEPKKDLLELPESVFMLADTMVIFDHVKHSVTIVANTCGGSRETPEKVYSSAVRKIRHIERALKRPLPPGSTAEIPGTTATKPGRTKFTSNFEKRAFCDIVLKAKKYIKKGDIIQVVLSQRFQTETDRAPFDIYRSLRSLNPSPYMFFLDLDGFSLIGSSPELMVKCEEGCVRARPIAGTRRRGKDEREDRQLEEELRTDEKEKAEHVMLVDLGRNDLGRVCRIGSVDVNRFMDVERFSHVMHLVSDVSGRLRSGRDAFDVLRACFPAGTVTGAPKVRAMEIIHELENSARGPYAGCAGYFSFSGDMDTCITIRTICLKGSTAYVQSGAGIVADSVPAREYRETVNKAAALMEAVTN